MLLRNLARRVDNRVQISTDGLPSYIRAVDDVFGSMSNTGRWQNFTTRSQCGRAATPPEGVTLEKESLS